MTKHDITFLHTDKVHIPVFSALIESLDPAVSVRHDVHADLLIRARESGLTSALKADIKQAMRAAADSGAGVVVCTCSTIGSVAEAASDGKDYLSLRIDRAMADQAVNSGGKILVVAALESTLESTRTLIESSAKNSRVNPVVDIHVVADAWDYFLSGDQATYHQLIARDIQSLHTGYHCVVLAQASMAPAVDLCQDLPVSVLSSPAPGVSGALEALRARVNRQ